MSDTAADLKNTVMSVRARRSMRFPGFSERPQFTALGSPSPPLPLPGVGLGRVGNRTHGTSDTRFFQGVPSELLHTVSLWGPGVVCWDTGPESVTTPSLTDEFAELLSFRFHTCTRTLANAGMSRVASSSSASAHVPTTAALGVMEEGGEAPRTAVDPSLLHLLVGRSTASADGASPTWEALGQVLGQTKERQGPFPQGVHSPMESSQDLSQDTDISITGVPIQAREGHVLPRT